MRNLWEIYEKITQCNRHEEKTRLSAARAWKGSVTDTRKKTRLSAARAWKVTLCSTMRNRGKGVSAARGWKVTLRSTSIIPESSSQQPWIGNSPFTSIVTQHNARKCVSGARTWKVTLSSTNQNVGKCVSEAWRGKSSCGELSSVVQAWYGKAYLSNMVWKVVFCSASERQESAY